MAAAEEHAGRGRAAPVGDIVYLCRETAPDVPRGEDRQADLPREADARQPPGNPVYADGKIYVTGRDGDDDVVQPGQEFKVLATNKLPDTFTASPGGRRRPHLLAGVHYAVRRRK